jgi:hypothetical protein
MILLQQGGGELKREIEERDRGTQETQEDVPCGLTTRRGCYGESGQQRGW